MDIDCENLRITCWQAWPRGSEFLQARLFLLCQLANLIYRVAEAAMAFCTAAMAAG